MQKERRQRKKLLVTGASGFLGWNLCLRARKDWDVFGIVFSHSVRIEGVSTLRVDLTDFPELMRVFEMVRPDAVIHGAALSNPNFCQLHPEESRRINLEASIRIAELCSNRSIPCVFTSSDLVFDGRSPPYGEDAPVSPISIYGEQKAAAESAVRERYPQTIICRLPLMFGDPGPAAASFIQPMLTALQKGRELRLFVDELRTPVSGADAALGLLLALDKAHGILHLGGPERISRFAFGRLLAEVYGYDAAFLTPCLRRDVPMPAPRPPDVSLESTRAVALGFQPGSIRGELEKLVGNDYRFGLSLPHSFHA